jgi:ABC-type oligopeptide transport system ATPase subunit
MEKPRIPIIELDSIVKRFGGHETGTLALNNVSVSVFPREIVAIVGESGSGKSTLARVALGLTEPDQGTVRLKGHDIKSLSREQYRLLRPVVQPIFQDSHGSLNPRRSLASTLRQVLPRGTGTEVYEGLLRSVGLNPPQRYLARYPSELSGGQRQRFSIARALASNPEMIIADEPLSGADVSNRGQLLNLMLDLAAERRTAYMMITHDISIAKGFAHRVIVMHKGSIVEAGPSSVVLQDPKDAYTRRLVAASPDLIQILSK